MTPEPLAVRLPATAESVPVLRGHARAFAERAGLPEDDIAAVELAVTEAATNAVVHAFVGRPAGTVELQARAEGHLLVIHVRDDGRGFGPRIDSPGLGLGVPTIGRCAAHVQLGPGPGGAGTTVEMHFASPAFLGPGGAGRDAAMARRLEGILGAVSEAVTVSAPDGHMVYCNQAAAELLGAESPEELADAVGSELAARFRITREDGALVSPEDLPHRHVLAGRRPAPLLTRSVHLASGRTRWLLTTSRPLDDETGPLAVNTILDVTQSTEAERRRRLLAEAASQLAAPHRLEETLGDVAALAVPTLADWCAVDLADAGGGLRRVALAHRDPALVDRARELQARYPADAGDSLPARVLRSGRPLLVPEISEAMLAARARGAEHLADLRGLGVRSVLTVPVTAGGAVVGALSLAQADSRRVLGEDDVAYAADVAALLGTALAA